MATVTSATTQAQLSAAYLDNCGYAEDASGIKAKAFITVCRAMQTRGIIEINHAGETMKFSLADLRELISSAESFLWSTSAVKDGGAGAVHSDLRDYRD